MGISIEIMKLYEGEMVENYLMEQDIKNPIA